MHPLLILLVGMATILGGILGLRLNAFLALVAAAIVVSLLAPGEPAAKIARVAEGFGRTAATPGPLAVAGTLGGDLGTVVLVGLVVSLPAAGVGLLLAGWVDRRMPVVPQAAAAPAAATRPLPGLVPSLLPIVLPVLLISSNTVVASMTGRPGAHSALWSALVPYTAIVGNPNLAMLVAAAVALWVYVRERGVSRAHLARVADT